MSLLPGKRSTAIPFYFDIPQLGSGAARDPALPPVSYQSERASSSQFRREKATAPGQQVDPVYLSSSVVSPKQPCPVPLVRPVASACSFGADLPPAGLTRAAEVKGGEAGTGATRNPAKRGEHGEDPPFERSEHGCTLPAGQA